MQRRVERRRLVEDDLDVLDLAAPRRRRTCRARPRCCSPLVSAARRSSSRSADSSANAGSSATSSRPPCPRASTAGRPATGSDSCLPSALTTRSRPGRSVTSILPSGRNASPHGLTQPLGHRDDVEGDVELLLRRARLPGERRLLAFSVRWTGVHPDLGPAPGGPPAGGAAGVCGDAGCCAHTYRVDPSAIATAPASAVFFILLSPGSLVVTPAGSRAEAKPRFYPAPPDWETERSWLLRQPLSRCTRVHGACGAPGLRPATTRRHDDTTKTFLSHFDGFCPFAAPRFARCGSEGRDGLQVAGTSLGYL